MYEVELAVPMLVVVVVAAVVVVVQLRGIQRNLFNHLDI